jgi:alpha-beta hydrolase superfamily lysophospholipase
LVDLQQDYVLLVSGAELRGLFWPVPNPRAVVAVAHGINEHVGRYEHVATTLNDAGYSVIGVDHRGHGRSGAAGKRTSNIRRFDTFVDDYIALIDRLRGENERPVVALGHSMGGLIAARAALRAQDRMAALVLSGPALKLPMPVGPLRLRALLAISRIAPFLALPSGNVDGLSRDPAVRAATLEDPLCITGPIRLGIARQLYLLSEETRHRAGEVHVPLLVMHGGADPITDPDGSREFVANASSGDKEFVLWPEDKHEIFNELDRDQVLQRLVDWLNGRFPSS